MPTTEYEIEIDDRLWNDAIRASGISDPSELANFALRELLESIKRECDGRAKSSP